MNEIYYVYALYNPKDPEKKPKYIGKTNNPQTRLNAHIDKPGNYMLETWVRRLKNKNSLPKMYILEQGDITNINELETKWIKKYSGKGLYNISHNENYTIPKLVKRVNGLEHENRRLKNILIKHGIKF